MSEKTKETYLIISNIIILAMLIFSLVVQNVRIAEVEGQNQMLLKALDNQTKILQECE